MTEITVRQRQEAAQAISEDLDKAVRKASAYGQPNVAGFDETAAYAGIAHALGVWWSELTPEMMEERLKHLNVSVKAAYHNQKAAESLASGAATPTVH